MATSQAVHRHEKLIKAVFAAVALLFPIQYWIAKTYGEPYPALLMPAFQGTPLDSAGHFQTDSMDLVVTLDDGSRQVVTMGTLFADAPSSHFPDMAEIGLKPKPLAAPENIWGTSTVSRLLKSHVFPGLVIRKIHTHYWSGIEPDTVAWINHQVAGIFPNHKATHMELIWYDDDFSTRQGPLKRDRVRTDSIEIKCQ